MIDLKYKEGNEPSKPTEHTMPEYPTFHVNNDDLKDVNVGDRFLAEIVVRSIEKTERSEDDKTNECVSVCFDVRGLDPSVKAEKTKEIKSDRKSDEESLDKTFDDVLESESGEDDR